MSKVVAIHQPNYLPWLGYFYKMANCDTFVLLDTVLLSKQSFTTRCQIKTTGGLGLLPVPLATRSGMINEIAVAKNENWQIRHWHVMQNAYVSSTYWKEYSPYFEQFYRGNRWPTLIQVNVSSIMIIRTILGLDNKLVSVSELGAIGGQKSDRIIEICKRLGADTYLSGAGARVYNDEEAFRKAGVKLAYTDFEHPVYRQLWGDFVPNLSIVDLLFNEGTRSLGILKASSKRQSGSTAAQ
jgi:hypothetical protein